MLICWPGMVYRLRVSPSITRVVDWRHKKDLNRCQSFWASVSGDTELSSTTIQEPFFLPLSRRSRSLCWAIAVQKEEVLAGFQRLTQVVGRWIAAVRPYWSDAHFIVVVMYAAASKAVATSARFTYVRTWPGLFCFIWCNCASVGHNQREHAPIVHRSFLDG